MNQRGVGAIAVGQILALLITGCGDVRSDGPLHYEDLGAMYCTPLAQANNNRTYAFGISFPPDLVDGISIDGISLVDPHDIELLETYLILPSHGGVAVEPFPPALAGDDWVSAVDATGQVIPVGRQVQVVAELQVGEAGGSFSGTLIGYSYEGVRYDAEQFLGVEVVQGTC